MNTKFNTSRKMKISRLARILWMLIIGLALVGNPLGSGPVAANAPPEAAGLAERPAMAPVVWRDDFTALTLDSNWHWTNENSSYWNLTENSGYLRIYASPSATGDENLLLRSVATGDFAIETRVLFEPTADFQFAGLVIFQDATNFFQFGRAFCNSCGGNGIYFDKVVSGSLTDSNFGTMVNNSDEAYLRLERRGETVKGFFSYEGVTWFEIGEHALPSGFVFNGVGLTASQDDAAPDHDLPADFDYFELSEGGGFLPEGYHDGNSGDTPRWACNASGWAVDPDDRDADLWVEIVVDDVSLPDWVLANEYRSDLEDLGLCVAGTCGFSTDLWDKATPYEDHTVLTYAQDIPSGDWVLLRGSPMELDCRTYDIYILDTQTGVITQKTDLRNSYEWNPRWSPDGTKIVHDRMDFSWNNLGIHITNVATGVSTSLVGGEDGSYPTWSPDGQWIAFNDGNDLYRLPPGGGTPTLISTDGFIPSWAPDSQRLVFERTSDGSLWTSDLGGSNLIQVVAKGAAPAWSPDGNWIAYSVDGDLWKVHVDLQGNPQGEPIQLTAEVVWEGRPSWSEDSQTIIYHKGNDFDTDIWSIPAGGGEASWLVGGVQYADFDPNYSFDGRYVAYSSYTLEGRAARSWISAYTAFLHPGSLADGNYPYHFEFQWTSPVTGTFTGQGGDFDVDSQASLYEGIVLLRGFREIAGQITQDGLQCMEVSAINPDQPARFLMGWVTDDVMTYAEAVDHFNSITAQVVYGNSSLDLVRHEIRPSQFQDWYNYVCSYTMKPEPPKQLFLPIMTRP